MTTAVQRRRGTTTEHSSFTGLEGEISVNTTKDTLVVHDGSTVGGFELARADGSNFVASTVDINGGTIDGTTIGSSSASTGAFTTLSASGEITANGGIALGDNDKATFGDSDDLQIYHNGSHNFITALVGNINIETSGDDKDIFLASDDGSGGTVNYVQVDGSTGSVNLRHYGDVKLATTSTGIDVTGTATMDGLTVDGIPTATGDARYEVVISENQTASAGRGGGIAFARQGDILGGIKNTLDATASNSQMSFQTRLSGTVATKMTLDASGNVGIGTSSPEEALHVSGSFGDAITSKFENTGSALSYIEFENSAASGALIGARGQRLSFLPNGTETMVIDASGRVGIGTSTPLSILHIGTGADANLPITLAPASGGNVEFRSTTSTGSFTFTNANGASEKMRINASGNVGIGTSVFTSNAIVRELAIKATATDGVARYTLTTTDNGLGAAISLSSYLDANALSFGLQTSYDEDGIAPPTERMRIDSSGNVGIGRASISQPSSGATTLAIQGTDNNKAGSIRLYSANDSVAVTHYPSTLGYQINVTTSHPMMFYTGGAERMRIDSSGRVGIGTGAPSEIFEVSTATANSAYLKVGTIANSSTHVIGSDIAGIEFYSGDTSGAGAGVKGSIRYKYGSTSGATTDMTFHTADVSGSNDVERLRIDSSGNLLVGTTSSNYGVVGSQLGVGGNNYMTRSGANPLLLNRLSSDGAILSLAKDGTTVGSIGTFAGFPLFVNATNGVISTSAQFSPCVSNGNAAGASGVLDLGASDRKWKDLYLSGGVYLGGTGAANHLDDYEEGTWTPVIRDTSAAGTIVAISTVQCSYTKIGRIVTLVGSFTRSDAASLTGSLVITGLPFTATGGQQMGGNAWVDNASGDILCQITAGNTSTMFLRAVDTPDAYVTTDDWTNLRPIYFTRTYQAS